MEKIKELPKGPGCYLYLDENKKIIYIGKAKNLNKRVKSYFTGTNDLKTQKLVSEIKDLNYFITNTEKEALILENNLIKKHKPKYNILLKDDKSFPYIVLTKEKNPRILKRRDGEIKGDYFGPYTSMEFVSQLLNYINKNSKLRKCNIVPKKECIYYHLSQCCAPCIKIIPNEEMKMHRDKIKNYLNEDMKNLRKELKAKMFEYSSELNFEMANDCKLLLEKIEINTVNQVVEFSNKDNFDVISTFENAGWTTLIIMNIIEGKVSNISQSIVPFTDGEGDEITSLLFSHYGNKKDIKIISNDAKINKFIENIFVGKVIRSNEKKYKKLLEIGKKNSADFYKNNIERVTKKIFQTENSGFNELKNITRSELKIIEMYDISHIGGDAQVGAKVSYLNGKKNPKQYRKYRVKKAKKADDYGSIDEVLGRRIERMLKEGEEFPDLIILDGGKGQVTIGKKVLESYGLIEEIMLIGLAKDKSHKTNSIINKDLKELKLKKSTPLYNFLYGIQEEVHRFAIDFHRKSKSNELFLSELDNIKGLGPKRKKIILDKFESIKNIKKSSIEELVELGIPLNVAKNILLKIK